MKIVLATTNPHKVREIKAMLSSLPSLDFFSLKDYPQYNPPPEEGDSFMEIATKKAVHAAKALQEYVLADDSGLVVPYLGNEPGIFSARYSKEGATDKENRDKLLGKLKGIEEARRNAYFECALALASPSGLIKCVTARLEGVILQEERGSFGFGYDSIFMKHDYGKTLAELEPSIKNRISHRRKAMDKMLIVLESLLQKDIVI